MQSGCKFCRMLECQSENIDIKYGESDHWLCAGDTETGNPIFIYKSHYIDNLTDEHQEEGKILLNMLTTKYWEKIKMDIQAKSFPHVHFILSEVK